MRVNGLPTASETHMDRPMHGSMHFPHGKKKWAQNEPPFWRFGFFGVSHWGKTGFWGRSARKIPSSGAFCVTGKIKGTKGRESERERERDQETKPSSSEAPNRASGQNTTQGGALSGESRT